MRRANFTPFTFKHQIQYTNKYYLLTKQKVYVKSSIHVSNIVALLVSIGAVSFKSRQMIPPRNVVKTIRTHPFQSF